MLARSLLSFSRPSVLVYHHIGPGASFGGARDTVSAAAFERQMALLREKGFTIVSLESLLSLARSGRKAGPRTVAITFDDGYRSTCTRALPILRSYAIPSTVFLATSFLGRRAPFAWLAHGEDTESLPMTWDQARLLHREGVEIGSHTSRHLFLPLIEECEVRRELAQSKDEIAEQLGCTVSALALPYSYPLVHRRWPSFERVLTTAMEASAYTGCCTLLRGKPVVRRHAVFLPRLPVVGNDTLPVFHAKALGLYAYSGFLQALYQRNFKNYGV